MAEGEQPKSVTFKLVLVGDGGTGKVDSNPFLPLFTDSHPWIERAF